MECKVPDLPRYLGIIMNILSNPHLPVPLHLQKVHVSQSRQYYSRNKENGWVADVKVKYLIWRTKTE